jgi:glycosyltransferase involved in cell wall biosynthesis
MRVAWLAPYPAQLLAPTLKVTRNVAAFHPCSWIVNLSNALAARPDVELHLVTGSQLVRQDQVVTVNRITFHVCRTGIPFTNRGFPPYLPLNALAGFPFEVRRFIREIRAIAPDLVHAHGTEAAFGLAGVRSGFPCLLSIQGIIHEYFKVEPSLAFQLIKRHEADAVKRGKYFVCRTNFDTQFVSSRNPQARIFMIYEAMHPVYFRMNWELSDSPRILFVGSWEKRKGLEMLCRALELVKKAVPGTLLYVIGCGSPDYVGHLKRLCAELGVEENVAFVGFKLPEEVARYHMETQLFVLPSESENSPNTLAEAMVSGMPVIATRVGGIPSMVQDGQTGLLVERNNHVELAGKIVYLLTHPMERKRLGDNAKAVARERHFPEKVAEQTMQAYSEILGSERLG